MTIAPELTTLDRALERGTERLLELQHPDGWWKGELESNATMIAQHLFWHYFAGLRTPDLDRKIANELPARRRVSSSAARAASRAPGSSPSASSRCSTSGPGSASRPFPWR